MEIALADEVPTYSGGLGVLAGDHLRAAADAGLDMVGVTLLYRQGYLDQRLSPEGAQGEEPITFSPDSALEPLPQQARIDVAGVGVEVGAWRYVVTGQSGAVPVYLLDTLRPGNPPWAAALTGRLYGGDDEYRLCQEVVLGMGGQGVLAALGHEVATFHMNEGHSALLALSLLRAVASDPDHPSPDDIAAVRRRCVFTTHTPVAAGHDRFSADLVARVLGRGALHQLDALSAMDDNHLHMTKLGIGCSRAVNAVSRRHGEITREMFPGVRIGTITNGIHAATWAAPATASLLDDRVPGWRGDNSLLRQVEQTVGLDELAHAHARSKQALLDEVARRTGSVLDPAVCTIGAARRATAYKRMGLLFSDVDRLRALVDKAGPLQVVLAGKAHPRDRPGQQLIVELFRAARALGTELPVAYLPGYSMSLAGLLVSGADVWLNTPLPPYEASGTSGMKAALNGVPNLSVLDGWWLEGYEPGVTGWAPAGTDAEDLYVLLADTVIPLYYGDVAGFTTVGRAALARNGSTFTTERMLDEYRRKVYEAPPDQL
jgi:starch phosphorylase